MRLVQGAMLPSSRPSHLAEVFLSGILKRIDEPGDSNNPRQDDVEYDFLPGIRDKLIGELPRHRSCGACRIATHGSPVGTT
jgi:hypothetical protein